MRRVASSGPRATAGELPTAQHSLTVPGRNHLPGLASSRGRGPAGRARGDGRLRETAAHLLADETRHARAQRAAGGLGAVLHCHQQPVQGGPAIAPSGVIAAYVERLAQALDFDPSLSQRVRREVEDHLWEAVAANPTGDRLEAERRAVANFGDPEAIAARFVVVSVAKARRTGIGAVS